MPNSPLGKIPYPSGPDAPAAAADMMGLVMAMDPRLVLPAIDEADRDSKYADAPRSTMVVSGQARKIWVKTGDGPTDWWTVYQREEIKTGFTAATGWSLDGALAIRNTYTTELRARLVRTGAAITAQQSNGNISPDVLTLTIPAQLTETITPYQITAIFRASRTSGSCSITVDGQVILRDAHPGSEISEGENVWISATWNN